jgi:hypothetical protein
LVVALFAGLWLGLTDLSVGGNRIVSDRCSVNAIPARGVTWADRVRTAVGTPTARYVDVQATTAIDNRRADFKVLTTLKQSARAN